MNNLNTSINNRTMDDSSNIINKQYINIETQNVKGFNNIEKRNYFFTLYNEELNLDIIGLTETKTKKMKINL